MLLPAGRGAASWLTGGGWVWPKTGAGLTASLVGLLTGHPSRGLSAPTASALPTAGVVYLFVTLAEVAWLIVSLLVLTRVVAHMGTWDARGASGSGRGWEGCSDSPECAATAA